MQNDDLPEEKTPNYTKLGFQQGRFIGMLFPVFVCLASCVLFVIIQISANGDWDFGMGGAVLLIFQVGIFLGAVVLVFLLSLIGLIVGFVISISNKQPHVKTSRSRSVLIGLVVGFLYACLIFVIISSFAFANCLSSFWDLGFGHSCQVTYSQTISSEIVLPLLIFFTFIGGLIGYRVVTNKKILLTIRI